MTTEEARRRPRDRRASIVAAAAAQFHDRGYAAVTMGGLAAEVGITAAALYRHFRGKQELLQQTVLDGLGGFLGPADAAADLDTLIEAFALASLDRRRLAALWLREARHLTHDQRAEVKQRFSAVASRVAALLAERRSDLSAADIDLLGNAALAVLSSPAQHGIEPPRAQYARLLAAMAADVMEAPAPGIGPGERAAAPVRVPVPEWRRTSRREELLAVAAHLFAECGYPAVSMEDIGAGAGMAGPSVYKHYPGGKAEILVAAFQRGHQVLQYEMARALAAAESARDGLERIMHSYARLAVESVDLVGVLTTEAGHLPADARQQFLRDRRDYLDAWVRLLTSSWPGLDTVDARLRVHAGLAIVNDCVRTPHLLPIAGLDVALARLGLAVLTP
ncbi:TetR/AcrR family transcriptional regulator [Streptomyces boninensis]|uniref:TetR/AcrR family transcriptional regulator n=1 Tax=Streptomyces boninensis TaxID=2039455 RepID=UPI003B22153B